jgi:hypothetical protein
LDCWQLEGQARSLSPPCSASLISSRIVLSVASGAAEMCARAFTGLFSTQVSRPFLLQRCLYCFAVCVALPKPFPRFSLALSPRRFERVASRREKSLRHPLARLAPQKPLCHSSVPPAPAWTRTLSSLAFSVSALAPSGRVKGVRSHSPFADITNRNRS